MRERVRPVLRQQAHHGKPKISQAGQARTTHRFSQTALMIRYSYNQVEVIAGDDGSGLLGRDVLTKRMTKSDL